MSLYKFFVTVDGGDGVGVLSEIVIVEADHPRTAWEGVLKTIPESMIEAIDSVYLIKEEQDNE